MSANPPPSAAAGGPAPAASFPSLPPLEPCEADIRRINSAPLFEENSGKHVEVVYADEKRAVQTPGPPRPQAHAADNPLGSSARKRRSARLPAIHSLSDVSNLIQEAVHNANAGAVKDQLLDRFNDINWAVSRDVQPPPISFEKMRDEILATSVVKDAIAKVTESRGLSAKDGQNVARATLENMMADIWPNNVRAIGYGARKVWRQMYEGIFVNEDGIASLRKLADSGLPIVLLPTHKSHMDYMIVTYIAFAHNLPIPHVVAGDNLKMPLVGQVLKHGGAFWIRRQFGDDELYKALFHEYIAALLSHGACLECFIEGGRSRSGKLLTPKAGFLSVLCDVIANKRAKEAMLVPISISYDKVIEGASYVNEMLGARKQKENLVDFLNAFNSTIRLNFGSVDIKIQEPFSLAAAIFHAQRGPELPRLTSHDYFVSPRPFVSALAHRILYMCNMGGVTTSTTLVAALLLTTVQRGMNQRELVDRVEWLKRKVIKRGGRVARIFETENTAAAVDKALKVLGKLIMRQETAIFGFRHREVLELTFYRNQIIHFFVAEALVAVAIAAECPDQHELLFGSANVEVSRATLLDSVKFMSQLFKLEFIYRPAPDFEENFDQTIEAMKRRGILRPSVDGRYLTLDTQEKDMFMFLCFLLWPFLDIYWISVCSLFALREDKIMEEGQLCKLASRHAANLYHSGHIDFYEAVSVDAIKNAYSWCNNQQIITFRTVQGSGGAWSSPGSRLLQLRPKYQKPLPPPRSAPPPEHHTSSPEAARAGPAASSGDETFSAATSFANLPSALPAVQPPVYVDLSTAPARSIPPPTLSPSPTSAAPAAPGAAVTRDGHSHSPEQLEQQLTRRAGQAFMSVDRFLEESARGPVDLLLELAHRIGHFRKQPLSRRDPDMVMRLFSGAKDSGTGAQAGALSALLRKAKL